MTGKEALESLIKLYINIQNGTSMIFNTAEILEKLNLIKQDLKRLEELEVENQDLKDNEKIITDYGYNLVIENEALKQGIATLTAKNNLLQEECDSIVDTNEILLRKNEYLTKQNQELVEKIKKYEREQYKQIR